MKNFPCWLTGKNRAIALGLIDAGFIYCGLSKDCIPYENELGTGYRLAKIHGWQLFSAYGEVAVEAICDGAVFGKCLELSSVSFEEEISNIKAIIRTTHRAYFESSDFIQLELQA